MSVLLFDVSIWVFMDKIKHEFSCYVCFSPIGLCSFSRNFSENLKLLGVTKLIGIRLINIVRVEKVWTYPNSPNLYYGILNTQEIW